MKLFISECKKLFKAKRATAIVLTFLAASVLVCILSLKSAPILTHYTKEQINVINSFSREYADEEKFSAFEELVSAESDRINDILRAEYEEAVKADKSKAELQKMFPMERYETHVYSDIIPDRLLMYNLFQRTNAVNEYEGTVRIILAQAKQNAETLRNDMNLTADDPLYQYQIYAYTTYKTVSENTDVNINAVCGWDKLLTYTYTDLFIFASVVVIVAAVFMLDRQNGMSAVIRASKNGRMPTVCAKLGVSLSVSTALTLLFTFCTFFVFFIMTGFSDGSASVQNIIEYNAFPYAFSMVGFYLYGVMLKVLSVSAFASLCGLAAALTQNQMFYYGSSGLLFGLSFFFGKLSAVDYPLLRGLNLYSICNVVPVSEKLYVLQPFVSCTSYYYAAPVICEAVILLSCTACVMCFSAVRVEGRIKFKLFSKIKDKIKNYGKNRNIKAVSDGKTYKSSIFSWECKKALSGVRSILILVIFALIIHTCLCTVARINNTPNREMKLYKRFVLSEAEGKFTENGAKCAAILDIFSPKHQDDHDDLFEMYINYGVINKEEGERIRSSLAFITKNDLKGSFNYAEEKYNKNSELAGLGLDPWFIDETGVQPVVTGGAPYALYAAVLFVCISLQMLEYGGKSKNENFANILRTAKNGRKKTFVSKLCAAAMISAALSVIFNVIEFTILTVGRDLSCLNAPIYSVTAFADAEISLTIIQYIIIMYACRVLISVLFAIFVSAVASLAKNLTVSFAAVAGSTLLPTLLYSSGLHSAGHISFCDFFGVNGMILFSSDFHVFAVYAAVFTAVTAALTVISARKFIK